MTNPPDDPWDRSTLGQREDGTWDVLIRANVRVDTDRPRQDPGLLDASFKAGFVVPEETVVLTAVGANLTMDARDAATVLSAHLVVGGATGLMRRPPHLGGRPESECDADE